MPSMLLARRPRWRPAAAAAAAAAAKQRGASLVAATAEEATTAAAALWSSLPTGVALDSRQLFFNCIFVV